jgi:hypothetical protein
MNLTPLPSLAEWGLLALGALLVSARLWLVSRLRERRVPPSWSIPGQNAAEWFGACWMFPAGLKQLGAGCLST